MGFTPALHPSPENVYLPVTGCNLRIGRYGVWGVWGRVAVGTGLYSVKATVSHLRRGEVFLGHPCQSPRSPHHHHLPGQDRARLAEGREEFSATCSRRCQESSTTERGGWLRGQDWPFGALPGLEAQSPGICPPNDLVSLDPLEPLLPPDFMGVSTAAS